MRFSNVSPEDEPRYHYLYTDSREHAKAPGDLQGLARGMRFNFAEWATAPTKLRRNFPCCYTRGSTVRIRLVFRAKGFKADTQVKFVVEPRLDGKTAVLRPKEFSLDCLSGQTFPAVVVTLDGSLPDDTIGRMRLELEFHCLTPGLFFHNAAARVRSEHHVFVTYDVPLDPESGAQTTVEEGSLTGTPARLEKFVQFLGKSKRHQVSSAEDLTNVYWEIHKGINNHTPPYFHGGNSQLLTVEAFPDFTDKPETEWPVDKILGVEDQWLMWVDTKPETRKVEVKGREVIRRRHWNDASCIGHAQLQKTMMALFGLRGQLAWVFPHTTLLPLEGTDPTGRNHPGDTVTFNDEELFAVDTFDNGKRQFWVFKAAVPDRAGRKRMVELTAVVALMHADPAEGFENFEGCFRSPQGLFLTGGFPTSRTPPSFTKNRGFRTAAKLLDWWTALEEDGRRRFLCWFSDSDVETGFRWFFDRFGALQSDPDDIRKAGNGLEWKP